MLSKIEEGDNPDAASQQRNSRNSLKDRFKLLRLREEAGIDIPEEATTSGAAPGGALAGLIGRSHSVGFGVGSPTAVIEHEKEEDGQVKSPTMDRVPSSPGPAPGPPKRQATINKDLPPGTAAGIASAPPAAPVDWDLWQNVVYEGPAAVARTSPEELTQAIASGIPQAIRGVVWQVLARSQNEELEKLYHELVARGTDKEKILQVNGHTPSVGESSKERDSVKSSASSAHSQHSTPASTPAILSDDEAASLHESLKAVRSRSGKDDHAKIQKLEKIIKRDLGARTSYSKYIMSAGLQDGLFGICKAYALYDEAVGYAQGMNFIAMPLLFNVSFTSQLVWKTD
jgi:Rab-GTPase-TBC domain